MSKISNEVIDDILNKADITNVIANYVTIQKKGNAYKAVCPFHDDHDPSLSIHSDRKIYKCFVCGNGGNVFNFVKNFEKISYIEAVAKVAKLINYPLNIEVESQRHVSDQTKDTIKALKDAKDFYAYVLDTKAGAQGKEYLLSRQIDEEMIKYFSLGFSPIQGNFTINQLRNKNNSVESLENAGILVRSGNSFSDRFYNRVMFPIYNAYDEVIGFSGRIISKDDDRSKYVNSPQTALFNKSSILYNIQNAKKEAKDVNYCYIVEGFMDVIALYKAGIKSSVAIMGTAFTKEHAKILKSLRCELRLCLDGDKAGQHAIVSMLNILDEYSIPYRIVDYKGDTRDPDEIYHQDGKDALLRLLTSLITKSQFVLNYYSKGNDFETTESKKRFLLDILPSYNSLKEDVDRDLFIQDISSRLKVPQSTIERYFKENGKKADIKTRVSVNVDNVNKSNKVKISKLYRLERQLFYYMLEDQTLYKYINEQPYAIFIDDTYALLKNYLDEMQSEKLNISFNGLINQINMDDGNDDLINEILYISDTDDFIKPGDKEIVDECLNAISKLLEERQFKQKIADQEFDFDPIKAAKLIDSRKKK